MLHDQKICITLNAWHQMLTQGMLSKTRQTIVKKYTRSTTKRRSYSFHSPFGMIVRSKFDALAARAGTIWFQPESAVLSSWCCCNHLLLPQPEGSGVPSTRRVCRCNEKYDQILRVISDTISLYAHVQNHTAPRWSMNNANYNKIRIYQYYQP